MLVHIELIETNEGEIMVMAYRVERSLSYKIRVNSDGKITTFNAIDDGGVSISFGESTHSEYYADEHKSERGLRIIKFEMTDNLWSAIKLLKKIGKEADHKKGEAWLARIKTKLPPPSGSDGAKLDSFTKKTALTFSKAWLPYLLREVVGKATIEYPDEETELFPAKADGEYAGMFTITQIKENGFEVDEDGWNKEDEDDDEGSQ
ncbi:hypothetical protein AB0I81_56650 [Nonomuraea sp. NPDC050404]|uniref:hypothetical protein n=1 Tax=Nonomuraea sp. NPDC050404 TaxID=3155783 RepID=UPI0033CB44AA